MKCEQKKIFSVDGRSWENDDEMGILWKFYEGSRMARIATRIEAWRSLNFLRSHEIL